MTLRRDYKITLVKKEKWAKSYLFPYDRASRIVFTHGSTPVHRSKAIAP